MTPTTEPARVCWREGDTCCRHGRRCGSVTDTAGQPPFCEVHGCRGRWAADLPHTLCGKASATAAPHRRDWPQRLWWCWLWSDRKARDPFTGFLVHEYRRLTEMAAGSSAAPVTVVLTGDQQEALRALWDLMPYFDALASDWYDLLPVEFKEVVER